MEMDFLFNFFSSSKSILIVFQFCLSCYLYRSLSNCMSMQLSSKSIFGFFVFSPLNWAGFSEDSLLCSFTWLYLVIKAALRHPISISQVQIEQQSTDYAQTLEQFQGLSVVFHNLSFFNACLTAYKRLVFCIMRRDHHAQVGSSSL